MRAALLATVAVLAAGCFPVKYLAQAGAGQAQLLLRARPLRAVVDDRRTDERTGKLLVQVPRLKRFGEAHGLTATQNYERFTRLDRDAAVWVVQACAPLAFEPRRWSFPIVGSVPYLGFFDEGAARAYAGELAAAEPLDVDVRPAAAYSTLGWFRDPVLSTMLSRGEDALGQLAEVVLHESVHATLYVPGQSAFDESLASFVGGALAREWLARAGTPAEQRAYSDAEARVARRAARLHRAYDELDAVYRSAATDEEKRTRKAALLRALEAELGTARPVNNASLAGFRAYDTGRPAFERLLAACGGDWRRFLGAVGTLRARDFSRPQQEDFAKLVDALAARGCAGR